ncbi:unnamed protein product [Camellia sinensis]
MGLPLRLNLSPTPSPHTYTPKSKIYMAYGWPEVIPLVLVLLPRGSSISNSPITSRSLSLFPAQGETGVVEERFRLDAKRRREYTGSLESVSQIDCRS